jgi:hypothetical protein
VVRGQEANLAASVDPAEDITTTLHGSQAIIGKAVWSANNAARNFDANAAERKDVTASEKEQRELIRMAEWDAARVNVGGVEMTNAEAQDARREIVKDGDPYAKWAVENGYIAKGEEEQFKDAARRMYDLKEAERKNGHMTEAQQREWDALMASREGHAVEVTAGHIHSAQQMRTAPVAAAPASTSRDNPFPNAPACSTAFGAATCPVATAQSATEHQPAPVPTGQTGQSSAPGF